PYRDPPVETSAMHQFNTRMKELLNFGLESEGPHMALRPPRLRFSWDAKREWIAFFDSIESELSRAGEFGNIADIGSKIAENAARMAAVFHVAEHGPQGELGKHLTEAGIAVVAWHLSEAERLIGVTQKPQDVADAELLLEWMIKHPVKPIDPRDILRLGPRPRDRKRRDAALKILTDKHWVFESGNPARLTINAKARKLT